MRRMRRNFHPYGWGIIDGYEFSIGDEPTYIFPDDRASAEALAAKLNGGECVLRKHGGPYHVVKLYYEKGK